jgi:uncharacterized protein (DUF885 family)
MTTVLDLADEMVNAFCDARPVDATLLGVRGWDSQLTDFSEEGDEALGTRLVSVLARARGLDPSGLSTQDVLTRAVVLQQAESMQDHLASRAVEHGVTDAPPASVADMLNMLPLVSIGEPAHADGYLARLSGLPDALAAISKRHRAGIADGRLPVRHLVHDACSYFDRYLANPNDPLRRPVPPSDVGIDARSFCDERDRLLDEVVRPALARYRHELEANVEPHGRSDDRAGLCWLPDGEAAYAGLVRAHTTTDITPDELHQIGVELIARLADEYAEIGSEAFGITDPAEIRTRLRTDPALRWNDGDELLAAARATITRAEQAAPAWFGHLPRQRCTVEAVPADEAPGASGAYYMPPAIDGTRSGTYFANTHRAAERDRYSSESIAFHEAIPGHHLQLTIAQEQTDLPLLRRIAIINAYAEGWGLYAERLADEMGLYSDALARLGMLAEDSMRAARLVVDTGLHHKGWSRQQVVEYLSANTVMPQIEIESETDRYIADPAQALAYMVGRLHIDRIRADAERTLGARFDIRVFHDVVLDNGSLPLGVLGDIVQEWVNTTTR